ncbi:MAG: hypothetical protein IJZ77_02735 [Bacilli bacterium]|nr:hypothetical protein [Bacilli bacterium]
MGYIVNQYNKDENTEFMTALTGGTPVRVKEQADMGIMSSQSINPFVNEGVYMEESLMASSNYYFHGKIKRTSDIQIFYIYLINKDDVSLEANQQYLKTITVQSGTGWSDVEFMFTPLINFNTILFKLQRTAIDYNPDTCRYPTIIYQELSLIKNLLVNLNVESLYKIGVQSRPGFLMCINGEEIRTGKSGIYELRNGFIKVTFFSAVSAADETAELKNLMETLPDGSSSKIESVCLFSSNVARIIDNFSLDYVYEGGTI